MKIITPRIGSAESPSDTQPPQGGSAFEAGLQKAVESASEQVRAATPEPQAAPRPEEPTSASVTENTQSDPVLSAAAAAVSADFSQDSRLAAPSPDDVVITEEHRNAFTESVISGRRYKETFRLLGGRVILKVRSRTNDETDAIVAYSRRMVATGKIKTDYEYSTATRRLLAVTQIDELNGVKNPELEAPLFFNETENGIEPPAWEGRYLAWGQKPESLLSAVLRCILEFEARYWKMIRSVEDENFWHPGESTGE